MSSLSKSPLNIIMGPSSNSSLGNSLLSNILVNISALSNSPSSIRRSSLSPVIVLSNSGLSMSLVTSEHQTMQYQSIEDQFTE